MTITARRTYDTDLIREVVTHPDMWATVAEDGQNIAEYNPDPIKECWLLLQSKGRMIALYSFNAMNAVTVEIHSHTIPFARRKYRNDAAKAALKWLYYNANSYKKVTAQVPCIYKNIKRFAVEFGFSVEGVNRLSYLKNGDILDQWILGITRDEIGEL